MADPGRIVFSPLRPTSHFRWRTVEATESDVEKGIRRSTLEQLWVNDGATSGEWRRVPQVATDAPTTVSGADLPGVL